MLIRFFVLVTWASGTETAYCASAESGRGAIELPITGRASDVLSAEAYEWPIDFGGPGAPRRQQAYRLKARSVIENALAAFQETGIQPTRYVKRAASRPAPLPRLAKATERPRSLPRLPWRA